MWFVKAVLGVLLLAGLLLVSLWNTDQTVNIYLRGPHIPTIANLELPVALVGSLVLGMLLGFVISFFQVVASKSEVAGLRRKNRELTRELTDLRNMPVKDLDPGILPPALTDDRDED